MSIYVCKDCGAIVGIEPKFLYTVDSCYAVGDIGYTYDGLYCPRCGKKDGLIIPSRTAPSGSSSPNQLFFSKEEIDNIRRDTDESSIITITITK
jgi:hypothetical protein